MRLEFKVSGPAFEDGMPLDIVNDSMQALQSIIERSYLVFQGRERISHEERDVLRLRLRSITQGSLEAELDLAISMAQGVLPLVAVLSPNVIWEYTKATFAFLKLVFQAAREGEQPHYEIGDDNSVHVTVGEVHHYYNAPVLQIGKSAIEPYRRLQGLIDEGSVDSVRLAAEAEGGPDIGVSLTRDDRGLFDVPSTMADDPIVVQCEIYDFNKYSGQGKMAVHEGQAIPSGKYPFRVIGDQDLGLFIRAMLESSVTVRCLRELRIDPMGETSIARLHVVGVQ